MSIRQDIYTNIHNWASKTTAHGFNKVFNSKSLITKLVWLIFLLISVSLCSFMIYRSFNAYFQYEVTTKITIIQVPELAFSQIQICDFNPLPSPSAQQYILEIKDYGVLRTMAYFNNYLNYISIYINYNNDISLLCEN